ncbi:MAG TPA: hypothetical protein VK388_09005 [Pyrinomonadaceae bacterium]|nr:hypothetical protein [Pyrinomonadaceae bacterium]
MHEIRASVPNVLRQFVAVNVSPLLVDTPGMIPETDLRTQKTPAQRNQSSPKIKSGGVFTTPPLLRTIFQDWGVSMSGLFLRMVVKPKASLCRRWKAAILFVSLWPWAVSDRRTRYLPENAAAF